MVLSSSVPRTLNNDKLEFERLATYLSKFSKASFLCSIQTPGNHGLFRVSQTDFHMLLARACVRACVCVCVCVFPSTVKASPKLNKTINVMPEIRPAMLC